MSYITQTDFVPGQMTEDRLVQLTDDDKDSVADAGVVAKAIQDAEAEINGYVATRYAVPIAAPVPDLVRKLDIDITIYNVWRRREKVPELVRTAYEDAVKKLEGIAKGTITLGVDPAPAESTKSSAGETMGDERVFTRDKLGSF